MGTSMTPNSFVDFDTEISILDIGHTKLLVSVCVDLRQIKLQVTVEDGTVLLFDGFIRADPSLKGRVTD